MILIIIICTYIHETIINSRYYYKDLEVQSEKISSCVAHTYHDDDVRGNRCPEEHTQQQTYFSIFHSAAYDLIPPPPLG